MASYEKFEITAVGHLCKHFERNEIIKNYSNQEIEKERIADNYNLGPERSISQLDFIHQRLAEVPHLNRKDLKVMTTWCITAPKDLNQGQQQNFFQKSYDFLEAKYGKVNIISSYVHMDETTPHMHFAFVPVVEKNGGFRISAKECTTKNDLKIFHSRYQKFLDEGGIKATVYSGVTAGNNKSIRELKQATIKDLSKEQTKEHQWGKADWGTRKEWCVYER